MTKEHEHELKKHSIKVFGHATSITLEKIYWRYLKALAHKQKSTLQSLIEKVDRERKGNLSSALRIYVLKTVDQSAHRPVYTSFYEDE